MTASGSFHVEDGYVLGGNVFGWSTSPEDSHVILDEWFESGGTHIDTADVYSAWLKGNSGGESEAIIGSWLARNFHRDAISLATKGGMLKQAQGLSADSLMRALEDSLTRLQTDYIDLYYAHIDDPSVPLEEWLTFLDRCVTEGKVKAIGASNFSVERLREVLEAGSSLPNGSLSVYQIHYNLMHRDELEVEYGPLLAEYGVVALPFYSLAEGFLTGKYRSGAENVSSVRSARAAKYSTDRGFKVLESLDEIAERRGCSMAAVALAWTGSRPTVGAPVASASSIEQLRQLNEVRGLFLDPSEIEALDKASAS